MIDLTLESLIVQDFRSIRGRVVLPIGAPVVLIHGPNGAGKSSLMSALALALGGPAVQGLASPEHLVHHEREAASIELATSQGPHGMRVAPGDERLPDGALDLSTATFFAERCYLEQTALTRLLELYQQKHQSESDSALARFVKELMRLDELDALIDGLHMAGHVTRVRTRVPAFDRAEREVDVLRDRAADLEHEIHALQEEIARLSTELSTGLADLHIGDSTGAAPSADDAVQRSLQNDAEGAELDRLEALARQVALLEHRWKRLEGTAETRTIRDAESAEAAAREQNERWRELHGHALDETLQELRQDFPQLPSIDTIPPSDAYDAAVTSLEGETARLDLMLEQDSETLHRLASAEGETSRAQERLAGIDRTLADEASVTALGSLASTLAELASHVADDHCPVCGRDFAEVSDRPLSAHLAEEISRLGVQAATLQATAKARLEATADLTRLKAAVATLASQRLPNEQRDTATSRRERLMLLRERLDGHENGARDGGAIMRSLVAAQADLSRAQSWNRSDADLRTELSQLAASIVPATEPTNDAGPSDLFADLRSSLETQTDLLRRRQARRVQTEKIRRALAERLRDCAAAEAERARVIARLRACTTTLSESRNRMMSARTLLRDVQAIRRTIISGVFNSSLNRVWADLFIRLAPDEPYVPAFSEPEDDGPVAVRLETRRRDGSRGGSPQDMLSAGNLNTAALTLFLALHLSVQPRVPWLLLDDPVQSMDEIHVSQFAALLRTLTQQHRRRVVIAVHERALFEYLTLELSPATPEDGLVTAQLRRGRDDTSSIEVAWRQYVADTAVSSG